MAACGSSSGGGGGAGSGGSGGSGSGTSSFSCETKGVQLLGKTYDQCLTYTELSSAVYDQVKSDCILTMKGNSAPPSCPTSNITGCCKGQPIVSGSPADGLEETCYYKLPSMFLSQVKQQCASGGGTFSM
jgi:hypothetical protein